MKKHAILSFLIAAVTLLHPSYAIADTLMDDDRKESPTVYPYQVDICQCQTSRRISNLSISCHPGSDTRRRSSYRSRNRSNNL